MQNTHRFSKKHRLRQAGDFSLCLKEKKRCASRAFIAILRLNQLKHARLGVLVPKKYFKRAVDRNRIKRLARESFREFSELFSGFDILILVKSDAPKLESAAWFSDMQSLWTLCKHSLNAANTASSN